MDWTRLSPKARTLFYVQAALSVPFTRLPFVFGATAAIGWSVGWQAGFVAGVLLAALTLVEWVWWPTLAWERWGYQLREGDLLVRRGIWVTRITAIPLGRVQHVDLRQGPVERWLSLSGVAVSTASGLGADGVIPGLELEDAVALRDRLVAVRGDAGL